MGKKRKRAKSKEAIDRDAQYPGIGKVPAGGAKFPQSKWPQKKYGKVAKFPGT